MFNLDDKQKDYVIVGLLIVALLLIAGTFYFYQEQGIGGGIGEEQAKTKATDFINENLMGPDQNATITEVTATGSLYQVGLEVGGQTYDSYMTKDGEYLFPQGYKLTQEEDNSGTSTPDENDQSTEIPEQETPEVELFVQSFCPYGNQAEDTMKPVYNLLGDKVDWNINFIVSEQNGSFDSLHGEQEVAQDKREICVLENQGLSKWFDFATYINENCGSEGECWEDAIADAGLDTASVTGCTEDEGVDYLSEDASVTDERDVSASPTLFINEVESETVYEYGNPNAYKEAICSAFEEQPAECEEELESTSDSNSDGGSC